MVHVTCCICGKGIDKAPSRAAASGRHYCSRDCVKVGKSRYPRATRSDKGSRRSEYVTATCPACQQPFERRASDARRSVNIYCSQDCFKTHGAALTRGGRPRKRPGGIGLPPNAQPETIALNERWPVKSWFEDNSYILLYMPDCPYAPKSTGRIFEHRLIIAAELGRRLKRTEHVHHKDENPSNNVRSNLVLETAVSHGKITAADRRAKIAGWKAKAAVFDDPEALRARLAELETASSL